MYPANFEACSLYDWREVLLGTGSKKYCGQAYHIVHLVRDVLQPVLHALHSRNHSRDLAPNYRL